LLCCSTENEVIPKFEAVQFFLSIEQSFHFEL